MKRKKSPNWENELTAAYDREVVKEGNGSGRYSEYRPYLQIRDVKSRSMRYRVKSERFNRIFHVFSHGEMAMLLRFEFDPLVIEVREQFPLDPRETIMLCKRHKIIHPGRSWGGEIMTTDFVITRKTPDGNGHFTRAFQVKYTREEIMHGRTNAKLFIEESYWKLHSIPWEVVVSTELNKILTCNYSDLLQFRNSALPDKAKLRQLRDGILRLQELYPHAPLCELGEAEPVCGWHPAHAVKMLCAHDLMEFPSKRKLIDNCLLSDFTMMR